MVKNMADEKTPLSELKFDSDNFREKLELYTKKEMEEYLKNYEKYGKKFEENSIDLLLTYFVEEKGNYTIEGKRKDDLGIYLTEGDLIVKGSAGNWAGLWMEGGSILIEEDAGAYAGNYMKEGCILIGGNAGALAGGFLGNGTIICMEKIESVSEDMRGGKIYAGEFKKVQKNMKQFTHNIYDVFKDSKEDNKLKTILKKHKGFFFPLANNFERQECFAEILEVPWKEVAFGYEKSMSW